MKKSLLLAAAALFGLAPQASALVQLTNDNCATEIKDGHVLALQCLDNNGGLWKFWNGVRAKSDGLNASQGLLQIEFIEGGERDGRQTFYLKDYNTPTNYLANGSVSWTTDKSAAAQWSAYVPAMTATNYDAWTTKPAYLDRAENTVRFDKGGTFLNANDKLSNPKYAGGKGGYSYWYAYVFTPEEAAEMVADNTKVPQMIQCKYVYESPKRDGVFFDGMKFEALEGTDISKTVFHEHYEGTVEYFNQLRLQEDGDYIVSATNTEFPLTMVPTEQWTTDWDAFMEKYNSTYKYIHRASNRPTSNEAYISFSYIIEGLRSQNPHKLFGGTHLWYLDYVGLDMRGYPQVKMMSVQKYGQGITVSAVDDNHAQVTENPTIFSFGNYTGENAQDGDFVLGYTDPVTSNMFFLNDRTAEVTDSKGHTETVHFFATYGTTKDNASTDPGCQLRFLDVDDAEFDAYLEEVFDCGYNEYLDTHDNGVDVTEETVAKAKETRLPEDVTIIFPENAALLQGLRTYKEYTGLAFYENRRINGANGEEDFYGIPGWVQDGAIVDLYNALDNFSSRDKTTWKPVAEARWAIVDATTPPAVSYDITPGAIFNMVNIESSRGYLVNDGGVLKCSVANGLNKPFDVNDKDFWFTFVKVGDNLYMYNLGAEKFMNAFGAKSDRTGPVAEAVTDHTWQFSDVPTIIRGAVAHSGAHAFSIAGGMTTGSDHLSNFGELGHEGGITMMNNCVRGVLVTLGNSNREDGSGLVADYVGFVEDADYQAIVEKAEKAIAAVPSETLDWSDIEGVVNHLTQESHALIAQTASEENKAKNGGQHDHIHYVLENADRQGFEADKVYNFFVSNTEALKVNPNTQELEVAEFDAADPNPFNLKVSVAAAAANVYYDGPESTTYNFIHNIQDENGDNFVNMTYNGTADHALDMSELGKVKLGDQTLVAKVGTGAATTGIAEITTATGTLNVYDLQGRKLAAPTRGINIINGQKTLVK